VAQLTISQIVTPLTPAQVRASLVNILIAAGVPANKWVAGGVFSTILTAAAAVLSMRSTTIGTIVSGFFLPLATGASLQLLALYVYGVTPPLAAPATGTLTLTNSGGGVYSYGIGEFTALNSSTQQTYTNTAPFTLNALATLDIPIACTVAGTIGNANPTAVDTLVTSLLGVTCSNAIAVVGQDALGDAALRQLCLDSLGVRSVRGPRSAYAYAIRVATNPVTGAPVDIDGRFTVSPSSHTGVITIYVSSPSGAADPNDVIGVQNSIEALARPEGVTVNVFGAVPVNYSPTMTVWILAPVGTSSESVQAAVDTAITSYISTVPIGALQAGNSDQGTKLFAVGVMGAVAQGVATIPGCTMITCEGATDLALTVGQVAVDAVPPVTVRILNPQQS
jgi:hypothetical protein